MLFRLGFIELFTPIFLFLKECDSQDLECKPKSFRSELETAKISNGCATLFQLGLIELYFDSRKCVTIKILNASPKVFRVN